MSAVVARCVRRRRGMVLVRGRARRLRWLSRRLGRAASWRMLLLVFTGVRIASASSSARRDACAASCRDGKGTRRSCLRQPARSTSAPCLVRHDLRRAACSALAMPFVLDALERGGFVSFVAARHVRATKSGFLTVISVLSIVGVARRVAARCASVVVDHGRLRRRPEAQDPGQQRARASSRPRSVGGFTDWRDLADELRARRPASTAPSRPCVAGEAMASSASNTAGVLLRGIDTETIGTVIDLLANIEVGKLRLPRRHRSALANLPAERADRPRARRRGRTSRGPDLQELHRASSTPSSTPTVQGRRATSRTSSPAS